MVQRSGVLAILVDVVVIFEADAEIAIDVGVGVEGCVGNGVVLEGVELDRAREVFVDDVERLRVDGGRAALSVADRDRVLRVAGVGVGSALLDADHHVHLLGEVVLDVDGDSVAESPFIGGRVGAAECERDIR